MRALIFHEAKTEVPGIRRDLIMLVMMLLTGNTINNNNSKILKYLFLTLHNTNSYRFRAITRRPSWQFNLHATAIKIILMQNGGKYSVR